MEVSAMLKSDGFNLWANAYDKSVNLSEEANEYPFAGYKDVLGTIYQIIKKGNGNKILDIGFGTGILSKKLYDDGCDIYGIDFSEKMIEIAKSKMPNAALIQYDFTKGLPDSIINETFDFIICTYAIHHLDHPQQVAFIQKLLQLITKNGAVLIGDVAFQTQNELEKCKKESGNLWDQDEVYPIIDQFKADFPNMEYQQISFCSGVLIFKQ